MASDNNAKLTQSITGEAFSDADGDNSAQAMKASAGMLTKIHIFNPNASIEYVQLFDAATGDVTVGTTAPDFILGVPASGYSTYELNLNFSTAITYACTDEPTGASDPGTGLIISATYT